MTSQLEQFQIERSGEWGQTVSKIKFKSDIDVLFMS